MLLRVTRIAFRLACWMLLPSAGCLWAAAAETNYAQPTAAEILANRNQAIAWAKETREKFSPQLHVLETSHFLIFSAWLPRYDAGLKQVCEEMYERLRRQFRIAPSEPIWIGKCPVFVFSESNHYVRFATEIDRQNARQRNWSHTAGYHGTRGAFSFIALNAVPAEGRSFQAAVKNFHEVLVHEGCHAFLNRYVTRRSIAPWVEEGLADYMAATVVQGSDTARLSLAATRQALTGAYDVAELFRKPILSSREYGVAHSLVYFLIEKNGEAFVRFVKLMKQGQSAEQALIASYGGTEADLVRQWSFYWKSQFALP